MATTTVVASKTLTEMTTKSNRLSTVNFSNENRAVCPRCTGYGYVHTNPKEPFHLISQKPTRCAKCTDCPACGATGFVTKALKGCPQCQARGFAHSPYLQGPFGHDCPTTAMCQWCVNCSGCDGIGIVKVKEENTKSLLKRLEGFPLLPVPPKSSLPIHKSLSISSIASFDSNESEDSFPDFPTKMNQIHPHLKGMMALVQLTAEDQNHLEDRIERCSSDFHLPPPPVLIYGQKKHEKRTTVKLQQILHAPKPLPASQSKECLKCHGSGVKVGTEDRCKDCQGQGMQIHLVDCRQCKGKGFSHSRSDRIHQTASDTRCFYCTSCTSCLGKKEVPDLLLKAPITPPYSPPMAL